MNFGVTSTRLHPAVVTELRWLFVESDGALGLRSNYSGMVARLQAFRSGGFAKPFEYEDQTIEAATRARRIRRALERAGAAHARTLAATYGPTVPAELVDPFGDLAGLVSDSATARATYEASSTTRRYVEWLARLDAAVRAGQARWSLLDQVRREADAQLVAASRAYGAAQREARE
jgi:hypothetical protein